MRSVRLQHQSRCRGSRMSRSASPSRLVPNTARLIAAPGKITSHGATRTYSAADFGQHAAPGGMRLRHAEAEERERGLDQDGGAELRGREHDQRRQRVRQHVAQRDGKFVHPDRARRLDVGHLAQHQRVGADHARDARHQRDRDRDDRVAERRSERRGHHQRHHQQRQRLHHVHEALHDQVVPAAEIARGEPDRDADQAAERGRADADRERDARAVDDAAPHVAAHEVGAENVRAGRIGERYARIGGGRVELRDPRREQRHRRRTS